MPCFVSNQTGANEFVRDIISVKGRLTTAEEDIDNLEAQVGDIDVLTTEGDLLTKNSDSNYIRLPRGANQEILQVSGNELAWTPRLTDLEGKFLFGGEVNDNILIWNNANTRYEPSDRFSVLEGKFLFGGEAQDDILVWNNANSRYEKLSIFDLTVSPINSNDILRYNNATSKYEPSSDLTDLEQTVTDYDVLDADQSMIVRDSGVIKKLTLNPGVGEIHLPVFVEGTGLWEDQDDRGLFSTSFSGQDIIKWSGTSFQRLPIGNEDDALMVVGGVLQYSSQVADNTLATVQNATNIASNASNIAANATQIAQHASLLGPSLLVATVLANQLQISTNQSNISINSGRIDDNETDIANNTTNIISNDSDISALQTRWGDSSELVGCVNFTSVSINNLRDTATFVKLPFNTKYEDSNNLNFDSINNDFECITNGWYKFELTGYLSEVISSSTALVQPPVFYLKIVDTTPLDFDITSVNLKPRMDDVAFVVTGNHFSLSTTVFLSDSGGSGTGVYEFDAGYVTDASSGGNTNATATFSGTTGLNPSQVSRMVVHKINPVSTD